MLKKNIKKNVEKQLIKKSKLSSFNLAFVGKEKDLFIENLAMLTKSGLDISQALKAIKKDIRSKALRKIIDRLNIDINDGYSLADSLARTGLLLDYNVSLVKIGEESGRLSDNLQVIVKQGKKDKVFKSKLRSAMMYPVFVLGLTLVVGIGIAWFILPRLSTVFESLKLELPAVTRVLISFGDFINEYGAQAVPVFFLFLIILFYFIFSFSKTKFIGQRILFSLPAIKTLIQEIEIARFGYLLGTLLQAGVPIIHALDSISRATTIGLYSKFYIYLKDVVEKGMSFDQSFESYKKSKKLFPASVQQIIVMAEQSGSLSDALIEIGESYERKTDSTTKNLSVILEPILLVIVWLGVVGVALAVILPIYSLLGGLNTPSSRPITTNKKVVSEVVKPAVDDVILEVLEPVMESEILLVEDAVLETTVAESILPQLKIVGIGSGYLNVREESISSSEKVGQVYLGDIFEYTQDENGWYQINLKEEEFGWIHGDYIELIELNNIEIDDEDEVVEQ